MDRQSGVTHRVMDKSGGVSLAFTRISKYLFESRLHRIGTYYLYSDLEVLDIESGSTYWLTWNLRARPLPFSRQKVDHLHADQGLDDPIDFGRIEDKG